MEMKTIEDGQITHILEVPVKATMRTSIIYLTECKRDYLKDLFEIIRIVSEVSKNNDGKEVDELEMLSIFQEVPMDKVTDMLYAYYKTANSKFSKKDFEKVLDSVKPMDFIQVVLAVFELGASTTKTTEESNKEVGK